VGGIGRAGVVLLMARVTQRAIQIVVIVHVAVGALPRWNRVRPGQREAGAGVVECRIQPGSCVMALVAALREVRCHVVGIRGSLVVLQVTAHAGRGGQVVVVVDVTIGALPRRNCMHARQREPGAVMVERRIQPGSRVVALIAALRKVRRHVIGIRCSLVILQVTGHTSGAGEVVIVVHVAVGALPRWNCVHAGQREGCERVIE